MSRAEAQNKPWTVTQLLDWTRGYFEKHGVESPRLCAEILLAHAMACDRIELYTRYQTVPTEETLRTFRAAVREAADGKPIAYLTGTKEFFALEFEVTPDVLIPRPETEVLIERTIDLLRHDQHHKHTILDVGTGSGCIAISLAKHLPQVAICASDVSPTAVEVARRNARRHGLLERIEFRVGDLFEPWGSERRFDVIVSNPPYVAESDAASLPANVRDFEPREALFAGDDGLLVVRRLIAEAPQYLRPGGRLLTEVAYNQSGAVRGLLDESAWSDIVTYRDALGHERVVHARHRASGQA
jgi:release factor glutamine methyltransferase